jgi:hypothetical protein
VIGILIALPLLVFVHRLFFVMRQSKFGAVMASHFPFPQWEIYYVILVFPGLVASSAQIMLMDGVHCKLAGLVGLSVTATGVLLIVLILVIVARPNSARRRIVFDGNHRSWLIAPSPHDIVR